MPLICLRPVFLMSSRAFFSFLEMIWTLAPWGISDIVVVAGVKNFSLVDDFFMDDCGVCRTKYRDWRDQEVGQEGEGVLVRRR